MKLYPFVFVASFVIASAAFATDPVPPVPPTPPDPAKIAAKPPSPDDQVLCKRGLLVWALSLVNDSSNEANRKGILQNGFDLNNCANASAATTAVK